MELVLTLLNHLSLERAQQISTRGAILNLDMTKEIALEVYRQIGNLAQEMDWLLPKFEGGPV